MAHILLSSTVAPTHSATVNHSELLAHAREQRKDALKQTSAPRPDNGHVAEEVWRQTKAEIAAGVR